MVRSYLGIYSFCYRHLNSSQNQKNKKFCFKLNIGIHNNIHIYTSNITQQVQQF